MPQRDGDVYYLTFPDTCRFKIELAEQCVTVFEVSESALDADLAHFLHDHVAPRIIAETGTLVLHASAVEINGRLALFLGQTGAGKSSLSASLDARGHRLMGDDAVIIERDGDGTTIGEPVYPSLRLFPEAIDALVGPAAETELMAGYSDKRHVKLTQLRDRAGTRLPVAALFFLEGDTGADICAIRALSATRACIQLVEQSFSMDPSDPACGARRLAACSALSLKLPAFQLTYPHDFNRLPEVHDLITKTMETLETASMCGASQ